jgi:hypothetical protein
MTMRLITFVVLGALAIIFAILDLNLGLKGIQFMQPISCFF